MARGLLLAVFDFSTMPVDEFHDWYDLEHLPQRASVRGFGLCQRWIAQDEAAMSVATYDLDSHQVLRGAEYLGMAHDNQTPWSKRILARTRVLLRFEGSQLGSGDTTPPAGANGLLINVMNVDPAAEAQFNAWYDEEHLPALRGVDGCLAAIRYRSAELGGGSHAYAALYHLAAAEVARGEAWAKAANTPWSERMRPHFRDRVRVLSRRYVREA